MGADEDLFELSPSVSIRFEKLGNRIPVLMVDDVYRWPDEIRDFALGLPFARPTNSYPGKLARIPEPNPSLEAARLKILQLVNGEYLRRVTISQEGRRIFSFAAVNTDFGIVDVHPDDLTPTQRRPHIDPVPLFGLIYLNREERGGTLFFEQKAAPAGEQGAGYFTASSEGYELLGRIEPAYNRLVIYPGFVPHTGEIAGDWIRGDDRFRSPRLTQRLLFQP